MTLERQGEQWVAACSTCGRRVQFSATGTDLKVLKAGDQDVVHTGGVGGLTMRGVTAEQPTIH